MALSIRVLDAETGLPASTRQYIGRYFGYVIATLPFCLGLLWVAFDARKQGWHDKLAGTVVVRDLRDLTKPASTASEINENNDGARSQ